MSDIKHWLEAQGLAQYAEVFAENDIDLDVLGELSEADLEKLGLSLGHRRKLLRALDAKRRAEAPAQPAPAARAASSKAEPEAERRQITVLFCDLVGSTELASALDPEDAGALLRRYQDACAGIIVRFEGFVAKFMGDGVLAYFGYPVAMEDAAEHAVRAAFALVDAVRRIRRPDGRACQARIGIATGIVVIGEVVGTGSARERTIAGETPNLAARLQALADPDAIIIGPRTHRLLGERFQYESLGEHMLKGFAAPVPVWRVLSEGAAESRFAARAAGRAAFVGRREETSLLLDRWHRAIDGQGQVVFISGEAGMGKSRLADALSELVAGERCYRVTCQCSPYHTNSALHPVIRHFERAAGFAPADPDAVKLAKLEAMLGGPDDTPPQPETALIADLLSLPTDRYPPVELPPQQRKAATLAALVNVLTQLAADAPVLLLLEDAHWIDPTTKELWTRLIDGIAATRLLALVTARPEFASPWTGRPHVSSIEVARITEAQAAQLVAEIASPRLLDTCLLGDIVAKSDGVPLYVEELTRSVLESSTPEHPAVPDTLHDSLLARLDRLGSAKEIAQVASVIGQQFSHALLAAVVSYSAAELTAGLLRLLEAGLAYRRSGGVEASYSFKHALVRDAAYENLLRARRAQIHERIGRVLAENFAYVAESEPEVLAHHFHHAGLLDLAADYRERAGDRAAARSSYAEAVAHFTGALDELAQLPAGPDRTKRELGLLLKLGPQIAIIKGNQSPELESVYQRAHEHAKSSGDETALFKATWGLWYTSLTTRRLDRARDRAEELMALGGRQAIDGDLLLEALHCRWSTALFRGDLRLSEEAAREGVRRYERAQHSWMGPVFGGHDPGVCAYGVRAIALTGSGRHVEATRELEGAFALVDQLGQPSSRGHALITALIVVQLAHDRPAIERYAQQAIELADRHNMPPYRSHAAMILGWAHALGGDLDAGVAAMETEFPRAYAVGPFFRYYAALLAEGLEKAERFAEALDVVRPALATVTEPGVGIFVSELYRLQGLCLMRVEGTSKDEAVQSLRAAVDVARSQGQPLLGLRAATTLARTAIELGRPDEGVQALRDLCSNLPGEFAAVELSEAREILASAA
ncbi:MAG TPA: adenylate/guanylate cyclase domain-containing protein [Casimicrobiaceae bacterium]|nr:adenylate/guanylate cyclase domain-containing protein [Casimicrobiaceae bacterium]